MNARRFADEVFRKMTVVARCLMLSCGNLRWNEKFAFIIHLSLVQ